MLESLIQEASGELVRMRREFHARPELSFEEKRTSAAVARRLRRLGLEVREGVGRTGVVARLHGERSGRVVALRADIDGLPIQEENNVPYASKTPGVMHACGHDGHTAILLTVARVLSKLRQNLAGEVRFIFQPAEEIAGGAAAMLEDGAFAEPRPEAVFGLHLWNNLPTGTIGVREGPIFANADEVEIRIKGSGGHGAMPHQTVDPVVVAAQVVTALQTLVSRELSPLDRAVVTIGSIQGGSAFNVIPPEVILRGTVRTFTESLQTQLRERIEQLVAGITSAMRSRYDFTYYSHCPAVVNDEAMSDLARRVAVRTFGEARVVNPEPTMGGDDMSLFLRQAPGTYLLLGTAGKRGNFQGPHHHPRFDIDEAALPAGVQVLAETAIEFLQHGG